MTTYETLLHELPALSAAQLAELRTRLQLLAPAERSDALSDLYPALHSVLPTCPPLAVLRTHGSCAQLVTQCTALRDFVHSLPNLTPRERRPFTSLCLVVALRTLRRSHIPVTVWQLGKCLKRIGDILEEQFPGYAHAGLLPMLVRRGNATPVR